MPITLVIGAPSALTSEVLSRAFERRRKIFKVAGVAHTKGVLLKQVAEHQPDVALIDTSLGGDSTEGLRALQELRLTRLPTKAILLVDCSKVEEVTQAFARGAKGVICKTEPFQVLCKCILRVHEGQVWADSNQLQWLLRALEESETTRLVSAKGTPLLTKREEQIARMVADGMPNSEICSKLGVKVHTVKNHLFHIYEKLGISNRTELLLYISGSRDVAPGGDDPPK